LIFLGRISPVKVFSDTLYADIALAAGGKLPVDAAYEDRAFYTVSGEVEIASRPAPGAEPRRSRRAAAALFVA
jgi:redox-sensitive bicupin YhaK (pirin superfamily)